LNLVCSKAPSQPGSTSASSPITPLFSQDTHLNDNSDLLYDQGQATFSPNFNDDSPTLWTCAGDYFQPSSLESTPDNQNIIQSTRIIYSLENASPILSFDSLSPKLPFQVKEPKGQHLLRRFMRVVSRTLPVAHEDEANPFLSLIVPLAGSSMLPWSRYWR
jgi:hypothetical protein